MSEAALVQIAEGISLILLSLAFVTITVFASRSNWNPRSLPFQMFLVIAILLLSETPRLLEGTGLVRSILTPEIEVLGLALHTVSMVSIAGFVLYRTYLFRSQFGNVVLQGIIDALTKAFDYKTAKVFRFYIDPKIALTDARAYERDLKHMFGKGHQYVLQIIIEEINHKAGLKKKKGQSLAECLEAAKTKLDQNS